MLYASLHDPEPSQLREAQRKLPMPGEGAAETPGAGVAAAGGLREEKKQKGPRKDGLGANLGHKWGSLSVFGRAPKAPPQKT